MFASITSSTAVVGLDPAESATSQQPTAAQNSTVPAPAEPSSDPITNETTTTQAQPDPTPIPDDPCSGFFSDFCVEIPLPEPEPADTVAACTTGASHLPQQSLIPVPESSAAVTSEDVVRVRVEIEDGLAIDGKCFAAAALGILNDERGWGDIDGVSFALVDDDSHDLRLILASPGTTDSLCYPARTVGKYSCRTGSQVIINLMRWEAGTDDYEGDLSTYRTYLINHEVGHFLGKGHVRCPTAGEPAPVMMQQTKGLGDCLPNGWPTKDEH